MNAETQAKIDGLWKKIAELEQQEQGAGAMTLQTAEQIKKDIADAKEEIRKLETEDQAAEHAVIQNDHMSRVTSVATQIDKFLENMDFGGMTLRQVIGGEKEYQLVSIEFKKTCIALVEPASTLLAEQQALHSEQTRGYQERETQLQRQNEILQAKISKQNAEITETCLSLSQERLERESAEKSRDNAVTQLDEANKEIAQHKSHIEDLLREIALGARGAIAVVDTAEEEAQKKELAEQIRKERTIYNVEWVDEIKRNKKKAKLAATGEDIEFPWTVEGKYFVIQESEVSQFREQYAIAITPEVPELAEKSAEASTPVEVPQFPTIQAPALGNIGLPMAPSTSGDSRESSETPVTRLELKSLEERIMKLETDNKILTANWPKSGEVA